MKDAKMARLGLFSVLLLLAACGDQNGDGEGADESPVATALDCRGQSATIGDGDGQVQLLCSAGLACEGRGPLIAGTDATLLVDLTDEQMLDDIRVTSSERTVVELNGNAAVLRDPCTDQVLAVQSVALPQAGESELRVERFEDPQALRLVEIAVVQLSRVEIDAGAERDVDAVTLTEGETLQLASTPREEGGAALTSLGAEYWWVEDPTLASLTQLPAPGTEDDEGATLPALQVRGSQVTLEALAPGTTRVHVVLRNVERSVELVVQ